jgi:hypothetical protein
MGIAAAGVNGTGVPVFAFLMLYAARSWQRKTAGSMSFELHNPTKAF